jgi:predicted HAD superfamily phosphohydrolase
MIVEREAFTLPRDTIRERTVFPEYRNVGSILATDLEGPHVLGDAVAEAMSRLVRPENASEGGPDYGHILYEETYVYFTEQTQNRRFPRGGVPEGVRRLKWQEAQDTVFVLAPLLAVGATDEYLANVAAEYQRTPGSEDLIHYFRKEGLVVGVTTAPEKPYKKVAEEIGLNGLVGSQLEIDAAREILIRGGHFDAEIHGIVRPFLSDFFTLVDLREQAKTIEEKSIYTTEMYRRIGKFYEEELGITYDIDKRKVRSEHKTILGNLIERSEIIGDRGKGAVAFSLFRNNGIADAFHGTLGDGLNDRDLLQHGFGVAINGGPPNHAKVLVNTPNMRNLIPVFRIAKENPGAEIDDLVTEMRQEVDSETEVHKGGNDVPQDVILRSREMKKRVRSKSGGMFP